jgi:hypothetical protein
MQRVITPLGQASGVVLWETKRTKNWSESWLAKLRADQRAAGAEIAVLVSTALPKGVETFGYVDRIWVTDFRYALRLAVALRQSLIEIGAIRHTQALSRCRTIDANDLFDDHAYAAAVAERHASMAEARKARCVLAEMRWR